MSSDPVSPSPPPGSWREFLWSMSFRGWALGFGFVLLLIVVLSVTGSWDEVGEAVGWLVPG